MNRVKHLQWAAPFGHGRRKNRFCPRMLSLCFMLLAGFRLLQRQPIWEENPSLLPSTNVLQNASTVPSLIATNSRHVFLGIFSHPTVDNRLRNVIRKTYLESKYETTGFPKICSIAQRPFSPSCEIVYAFVGEGQPDETNAEEVDMLFLPRGNNRIHQLFLYFLESNWTRSSFHFDFLAVTHSRVVLYPDRIWSTRFFEGLATPGVVANSMMFVDAKDYNSSQLYPDYLLLSTDLVRQIMTNSSFHPDLPNNQTREALERITRAKKLDAVALPDREVTTSVSLRDYFKVIDDYKHNEVAFLLRWDQYKDKWHVKYEDSVEATRISTNARINHTVGTCIHGPRVLAGIFTMQKHEKEIKRRQAIRETYLSFFNRQNTKRKDRNRICSLFEFLSTLSQGNNTLLRHCQMAYVFVAAGNRTGPTERVVSDASNPIALPLSTTKETDLILLNIKENMNEGKSQSFFKFATTIIDEHLYFDYIAKVDSDTLVFPDRLLNNVFNKLPKFPRNVRVFGGDPRMKKPYNELNGPTYQQGAFYWMSLDLARFITSQSCDRERYNAFAEDMAIGNFVHAHPLPIHRYQLSFSPKPLDHPIKKVTEFKNRWAKYIQKRSLGTGDLPISNYSKK